MNRLRIRRKLEENVVESIISGTRLSFPRDDSYKLFPITPQQIEEQAKVREEANRRLTLTMQPYDEEFSAVEARKELLNAIAKADDDVAIDVISNINEVEMSKAKTDDDSNLNEGNVAILSRLDTVQNISVRSEKKNHSFHL